MYHKLKVNDGQLTYSFNFSCNIHSYILDHDYRQIEKL